MTNACAWFNVASRPQKPSGSLGQGAQVDHLDSHTAPELCAKPDDVELNVLGCRVDISANQGQTVTNACAWFNVALRPQKP